MALNKCREDGGPLKTRSDDFKSALKLLKELFKFRYKDYRGASLQLIQSIYDMNADKIGRLYAHGVEESKGGLANILSMFISKTVFTPSKHWGSFVPGLPNISPIRHGPYYLVKKDPLQHNNPSIDDIDFVLLPFQENIDDLKTQCRKAVSSGLLEQEDSQRYLCRCITYEQFETFLALMP